MKYEVTTEYGVQVIESSRELTGVFYSWNRSGEGGVTYSLTAQKNPGAAFRKLEKERIGGGIYAGQPWLKEWKVAEFRAV